MKRITTLDIELAMANYFNVRQNLVVPNVSWGMFNHECDLVVLTAAGYAYEIEIKISLSDLKAEQKKRHNHEDRRIKRLYFAIPEHLLPYRGYIPERAGIFVLSRNTNDQIQIAVERKAKDNSTYKFSDLQRYTLARLGALRLWRLKTVLRDRCQELKELREERN